MGVEYYYVDMKRKEYVELGKFHDAKELLDLLIKSKKTLKSYRKVFNKIIREFDYFQDLEEGYEIFLREKFFKELYNWINPDIICYNDWADLYSDGFVGRREDDIPVKIFDTYTCALSRFPKEGELEQVVANYNKQEDPVKKAIANLEAIKKLCATIHLETLDHDDRVKLYDIMFADGLVDETISLLKQVD